MKAMTRGELIRSMSDEELLELLMNYIDCDKEETLCSPTKRKKGGECDGHCRKGRLKWLKEEAEEEQ